MDRKSRVGFLILFFLLHASPAKAALNQYEQVVEKISRAIGSYQDLAKQTEVPYEEVRFRRDPLRSLIDTQGHLVSSPELYDGLALQGIILSEGFTKALIDDEFYGLGDAVGPYRILQIRSDGITTQRGNEILFVPLYPESDAKADPLRV